MNPNDPQFGQLPAAGPQPMQQPQGQMAQSDVYGSAHTQNPASVTQQPMQQPAEQPADSAFGAFGSLPTQPQSQPIAQQQQPISPQPTATPSGYQGGVIAPVMMTPEDEADLFGKEKLSIGTKILIVGAVIAALGSVVAVGLWLYSTYIKTPNTGSTPNGAPAANVSVNKASSTQDTDGDGLTDAAETGYGSDPKKADTDGDGFADGAEVKNGYNPAGPGKLQ
jgi:hypothetical protein